jgi:hypothetical protein
MKHLVIFVLMDFTVLGQQIQTIQVNVRLVITALLDSR